MTIDKQIIKPDEVWGFFKSHIDDLSETEVVIAENEDEYTQIFLTEELGYPLFIVRVDGNEETEESATSEPDCAETAERLYDLYITGDYRRYEREEMIEERESELDYAVDGLLDIITEGVFETENVFDPQETRDKIKDMVFEYLAKEQGLTALRRPMIMTDEDTGKEFFTEYPYECMVYDE